MLMEESQDLFFTKQSMSRYLEVNEVLMQSMLTQTDVALIDMPELLLRMKIGNELTLEDLQDILNTVLNKMARKECPCLTPGQAALYYFPEVFSRPRDEYVAAMLKEIATHMGDGQSSEEAITRVCCYLGNVHVQPIARLWNTYSSDGVNA